MQRITKGTEPAFLAKYRLQPDADWDQNVRGDEKQEARELLCKEQGTLCCFCEGRIEPQPKKMKVAHFVPQAVDKSLMFSWHNLLGACRGGEKLREKTNPKDLHCDTKQGNQVLDPRLNPVQLAPNTICFNGRGEIRAVGNPALEPQLDLQQQQLQAELDVKLNLNLKQLVGNRIAAKEAMIVAMGRQDWTLSDVQRKIRELTDPAAAKRVNYQSYLLWWLERKRKSLS